jgi:hypothetical protein
MPFTDPDWTDPIEATFDPEKAIRSEQGILLSFNPIALALAKPGAPYIVTDWHPFDGAAVGDGNEGVIYDFATDGGVTEIVSPDFAEGWEYAFIFDALATAGDLTVELFRATSGSYSDAGDLDDGTVATARPICGRVWIPAPQVASNMFQVTCDVNPQRIGTSNTTNPGAVGGVRVFMSTKQVITRVRFASTIPTTGGRVLMHRRRVFG